VGIKSVTRKSGTADLAGALLRRFEILEGVEIVIGWFDDPNAATIAAINYFGNPAGNLPARDTLTPTIQRTTPVISQTLVRAAQAVAAGQDPMPLIEGLELVLGEELKQSIREFSDPPNAPRTIAKKGFNDPLIGAGDGGRILRAAGARVRVRSS
jgi:hypothetical protein